ncbi:hypothetical protein ACM6U7_004342 [Vibrio vulnificus]
MIIAPYCFYVQRCRTSYLNPRSLSALESTKVSDLEEVLSSEEEPKKKKVGEELRSKISKAYDYIEFVVFSESETKKIYEIPKRRFNSDYLLNSPNKLFAGDVFSKLDDIAQNDIKSACRCLLFGEATATAFHILRATESTLKSYYFMYRTEKRLRTPMWGNMLDQLNAMESNKPPEHLLTTLDIIRRVYRNPTQHPQATYETDSAQDLFGVCLDVIGKMGSELT